MVMQTVSPDKRFTVTFEAYNDAARGFYGWVSDSRGGKWGIQFGYGAPISQVTADRNLPDSVLGVYIAGECYMLFRWGPRRRRKREWYRCGEGRAFTAEEIDWVCQKKHVQRRYRQERQGAD